jgi:site-specific DNA-methyltransferase (adenine-specific)/site-specific DNA-methyltransferase (cytosine-N4-specific)
VAGQVGAEGTVEAYLASLVAIFREVRRTLSDRGTLWVNLGDAYTSGGRTWRDADKKNPARGMGYRAPTPAGLKPKDLVGLPWRLAFALQADGWYLRSDVVWHKPNAQPESVKDRPTRAHEYLFLLSKSEHYDYDHAAVKEPSLDGRTTRARRSVWSISTEPLREAHFATFPPKLVEPCVRASTQEGQRVLDPFFGAGTVGLVAARLGRTFTGIELNPAYVDIARRRLLAEEDAAVGFRVA